MVSSRKDLEGRPSNDSSVLMAIFVAEGTAKKRGTFCLRAPPHHSMWIGCTCYSHCSWNIPSGKLT